MRLDEHSLKDKEQQEFLHRAVDNEGIRSADDMT